MSHIYLLLKTKVPKFIVLKILLINNAKGCCVMGKLKLFKKLFGTLTHIQKKECLKLSILYNKMKITKYIVGMQYNLVDIYDLLDVIFESGHYEMIEFFTGEKPVVHDYCLNKFIQKRKLTNVINLYNFLIKSPKNEHKHIFPDKMSQILIVEKDFREFIKYFIEELNFDMPVCFSHALKKQKNEIVKYIIEKKNIHNKYLIEAVKYKNTEIVKILIQKGADIKYLDYLAVRSAIFDKNSELIKYFIEQGFSLLDLL